MVHVLIPSKFESKVVEFSHLQCGMGKINAIFGVYQLHRVERATHILLSGFCGGISGVSVGDIVSPNFIVENDFDARPLEEDQHIMLFESSLEAPITMLTQDKFMQENLYQGRDARVCVDMESYAVACACRQLGIKLKIVKIVSDIVGQDSAKSFTDSCQSLAPTLNQLIEDVIKDWA